MGTTVYNPQSEGVQSGQRVAIYARVSTTDQACQRQIAEFTAFADRGGFEVLGVFRETASRVRNNRLARNQVMEFAQARRIDAVLPYDPPQHYTLEKREYQKVWGAELYGQVSPGDFLVREPVSPIPGRACYRRLTPQILVLPLRWKYQNPWGQMSPTSTVLITYQAHPVSQSDPYSCK